MSDLPKASVIVITRDRRKDLRKLLSSLEQLSYPREKLEIIVVEEGDSPKDIPGTKYIFLPRKNKGLGFARNTGVKNATGDILAFTDDDCIADKDWLENIVRAILENNTGGACGGTLAQKGNIIGRCEEILGFPGGGIRRIILSKGKIQKTDLLSGCNCAFRKEVFCDFSFNEDSYGRFGADDCVLGKKVAEKYGAVFNPYAVVYHKPRGSLRRIILWFYRRRINEILIQHEKLKNRWGAVLLPISTSILVRIMLILLMFLFFKGSYVIFFLVLSYFAITIFKHRKELKTQRSKLWRIGLTLPIVKLSMDIGVTMADARCLLFGIEKLDKVLEEYSR